MSRKSVLKQLRREFREAVLERDEHRCRTCGAGEPLDAHHIRDRHEMPADGYSVLNGITLCDRPDGCHRKAEVFHISGGARSEPGFHPDELYAKIGTTAEIARDACLRLERQKLSSL